MMAIAACQIPDATFHKAPTDAQGADAAPLLTLPNCVGLPKTCGYGGIGDCCESFVVEGGTYYRSYDKAGDSYSGDMSKPATVSSFRLDKYEVTVGRFRAFVNAGMGTMTNPPISDSGAHENIAGSGWKVAWSNLGSGLGLAPDKAHLLVNLNCSPAGEKPGGQTWTDAPGPNENRPMTCISWYEAMAFCAWDGGYLPTEAEWNYAAAGGNEQRAYAWSTPPGSLILDNLHASYAAENGDCTGDGMPGCATTDLLEVGTRPAGDGRWGHSDLTGNASEWNLDWEQTVVQTPCVDCSNLTPGTERVIRGGSAASGAHALRTGYRNHASPDALSSQYHIGARCARAPGKPVRR